MFLKFYWIFILKDWSFLRLSRVLMVIRQGYSLPLPEFPPRCVLSNNCSALRNLQFFQSVILELLEKQLVHVHDSPPHCVYPLTVMEVRKLRLIWLSPNFVLKIWDLRAKFFNRGFGYIHGTLNKVTIMWIFFNLISNFFAFRGIN